MQTRRDRLQAYQYLVRRILAALLGNEPESPEQPMRRVKTAMFSGIMVGALACGGVAFYGWISNQGARGWQEATDSLVQIKETGAQYWWDGKLLRPVTNYTSAKLILGADMGIREIARASLLTEEGEEVPRGPEVGIRDVPSDLPGPEGIENGRWTVCNHVTTEEGRDRRLVDLIVNEPVAGSPLNEDDALLVAVEPSQDTYLLWDGRRLEAGDQALRSLGLGGRAVKVLPSWLNAIPPGEPLVPKAVDGLGESMPDVGDHSAAVGQIFLDNVGQYYVMKTGGLVQTTETEAFLILGSEFSQNPSGDPTEINVADTDEDVMSAQDAPIAPADHPDDVPELVELENGENTSACMHYDSSEPEELGLSVGAEVPAAAEIQPIDGIETGPRANRVTVPGGTVSLIRAVGNAGSDGTLYIVAGSGKKYPIPSHNGSLTQLGYGDVDPMPLPEEIANMLWSGSALDIDRAQNPVIVQGGDEQSGG